MGLDSFNVYHSYLKALEPLNDAECGRLLRACIQYSMTGEVPELRGNERFLFPSWQSQIDRDREKYEAKCRRNSENVSKRWNTTVYEKYERIPDDTKHTKDKDKDKDKDNIKEKTPSESKRKVFVPPTVDEVRAYCTDRKNGIDPQSFVDFYSSKGWVVGKSPMKDWKAAVRTWEHSRKAEGGPSVGTERLVTLADLQGR